MGIDITHYGGAYFVLLGAVLFVSKQSLSVLRRLDSAAAYAKISCFSPQKKKKKKEEKRPNIN